ncbi:MAG: lipoprotein insertase outer membrane protein LolB [Gammaproteobacteria bacterium]
MISSPMEYSAVRFLLLVIALVLCCFIASCESLSVKPEQVVTTNNAVIEHRQSQLAVLKNWQLDGRISLVTDNEAWSGQLYWQQNSASDYFIQFSAPSGQGAMQLLGSSENVELRMANGKSYQAKDADSLLRQETNWELPIGSLWYWIRGLPNPDLPVKATLDQQGLIQALQQNDWHVEYKRYQQYDAFYFPRKIVIQHEDMKLRLIVTQWTVS